MADAAIIFDVDGVLLELTRAEEEVFFTALSRFVPTENLSRDWNSYRIRNDDEIIAEILDRHGLPSPLRNEVKRHYLSLLEDNLRSGVLESMAISGAEMLLESFRLRADLGIATANLLAAAELRLKPLRLWNDVKSLALGADGGGHKHEILERLLQRMDVPRARIVYVGDNLNDLEAGVRAGVQFIGFSTDAARLAKLRENGARWTSENHTKTMQLIAQLLFTP
jgi:phosphoglycolate phosphatase-like HAD superfamily hydrolase